MVTGKQKEQKEFIKEFYVGLTEVKVAAVSPTLAERCEMFGVDVDSSKSEPKYVDKDDKGNDRVRLDFWFKDVKTGKFFNQAMFLVNSPSMSKDGKKVEVINSTCNASYVPFIEGTQEPDTSLLLDWVKSFIDKKSGQVLGEKKIRVALEGEKNIGEFMQTWLGRLNFKDPDTEVLIDTKKLFNGDFSEFNSLIDSDYDTTFTVLLGVETDDDGNKKQKIWYQYLPNGFMKYINNGMKFPSDYAKNKWEEFSSKVTGQYGFKGFTELVPLKVYNEKEDVSAGNETKVDAAADY